MNNIKDLHIPYSILTDLKGSSRNSNFLSNPRKGNRPSTVNLYEVMQEATKRGYWTPLSSSEVTIDGTTYPKGTPILDLILNNAIEEVGTMKLWFGDKSLLPTDYALADGSASVGSEINTALGGRYGSVSGVSRLPNAPVVENYGFDSALLPTGLIDGIWVSIANAAQITVKSPLSDNTNVSGTVENITLVNDAEYTISGATLDFTWMNGLTVTNYVIGGLTTNMLTTEGIIDTITYDNTSDAFVGLNTAALTHVTETDVPLTGVTLNIDDPFIMSDTTTLTVQDSLGGDVALQTDFMMRFDFTSTVLDIPYFDFKTLSSSAVGGTYVNGSPTTFTDTNIFNVDGQSIRDTGEINDIILTNIPMFVFDYTPAVYLEYEKSTIIKIQ